MRRALPLECTHAAIPVALVLLAIPLANGCAAKHSAPEAPIGVSHSALTTESNEPAKASRALAHGLHPHVVAASPEAAGRYLVLAGACNDCHTPDWNSSHGKLPDSEWLTGKSVGYRGPWGTTYPMNLRLSARELSQRQWVRLFREQNFRPPMPGHNWVNMAESDLVAIYRFIRSLGPAGRLAPDAVAPGLEPRTPYILLEPQQPMP